MAHRVAIIGDPNAGKTSIIASLIQHNDKTIPKVFEPITLDLGYIQLQLIDTDSDESDKMQQSIEYASVVMIVYSLADSKDAFQRVKDHWIPLVEAHRKPFVLVQSKVDLNTETESQKASDDEDSEDVTVDTSNVVSTYRYCFGHCAFSTRNPDGKSATPGNVEQADTEQLASELAKPILYPIGPLYDLENNELRPAAYAAFKRVFWLISTDKRVLTDRDFAKLIKTDEPETSNRLSQSKSGTSFEAIHTLKKALQEIDTLAHTVTHEGITLEGFMSIIEMILQMKEVSTAWEMLKAFDCRDHHLSPVNDDVLHACVPSCSSEEIITLSEKAIYFLKDVFIKFDHDNDNYLSEEEISEAFSITPGRVFATNFMELSETDPETQTKLTMNGWVSQWCYLTLQNPYTVITYLKYWGRSNDELKQVLLKKKKRNFRTGASSSAAAVAAVGATNGSFGGSLASGASSPLSAEESDVPNIIQCYVFGSLQSGKTSILRGLVNKPFQSSSSATAASTTAEGASDEGSGLIQQSAVNAVKIDDQTYFLVMTEFADSQVPALLKSEELMSQCDVACLIYDGSEPYSFGYIAQIQKDIMAVDAGIPCVYVIAKSDRDPVDQRYDVKPNEFCEALGLPWPPVVCSMALGQSNHLYRSLVFTALNPEIAIPSVEDDYDDAALVAMESSGGPKAVLRTVTVVGTVLLAGYLAFKFWRRR